MTAFPSVRNEGGLLGSDLLDQLLAAALPGQKPADFGLEPRRSPTDEVAALFADARALWGVFQNRRDRLREGDPATTVTRDWAVPFLGLLGYELRYNQKAYEVDGLSFAISHRAGEGEDAPPVHIVGAGQPLGRVAASGRPRLAPHSLVQEYLNRTDHVWGLVTNGLTLRLLRDSTFIRRQAYVEFDLQVLLEGQHFQDFMALYRLLHRTRLPRGQDDARDCLLEKYHAHSEEQGGRVREHLREGVEKCLALLANGFLRHPANDELRQRVARSCTGNELITPDDLYRQLLRLVYRFLFLLVSEDRGLLSRSPLYREHYGVGRLRRLLDQRGASDHDDLWQSLRVLWRVLADERFARFLDLAPLNGELFNPQDLDHVTISNRDLLEAFWHLAWYQESRSTARRVNYAALDVEELGSVYESLLEFHPAVEEETAGRPFFALLTGSERKTTGSYYTPPELVAELIKSALEPALADRLAAWPKEPEKAILSIRVCDPACGSGHFLLAAARRLGKELARVRSGEEEPAPERVREAVRDVISHCIYGVDKNPLAVDLCRVALWLESHTGDKPLTFLDHRIRLGNSLVGVFDLAALAEGIPDEAFKPLEGDEKATARALTKRNREEHGGQMSLGLVEWTPDVSLVDFTRHSREVDAIPDDSPEAIRRKKQLFERSHDDPAWRRQRTACDLWTAAFFQPLSPGLPAITSGALVDHLSGRPIDARLTASARALAQEQSFFHWKLEFPEVFEDGGFDVIISNPPWEQVELNEQEFFAARDFQIASAPTKAARSLLIQGLATSNPELFRSFGEELRESGATRRFLAKSGRYPLAGRGRINTYSVFAELAAEMPKAQGRAGLFLPTGIATDDITKLLFGSFVATSRLAEVVGFENEEFIFPAVHHSVKFCKLVLTGGGQTVERSRIAFYIRRFAQLAEENRFFYMSRDDFRLVNPNTGNCPVCRSQADAELLKAIYRRVPVLWREAAEGFAEANPWGLRLSQGLFNMASKSGHFLNAVYLESKGYRLEGNRYVSDVGECLPLYEAKMLHQFDHRFSTYEGATKKQLNAGILPRPSPEEKRNPFFVVQPQYWVDEALVESSIGSEPTGWLMGWRDMCRSTDERTTISTALPRYAVGDTFLLMFPQCKEALWKLVLIANLNSFVQDYCSRQKVGGTHLKYPVFRQLAVLPPSSCELMSPWDSRVSLGSWFGTRSLELLYSAYDLAPLAQDCGFLGSPFLWDEDRRFEIRCELDAAFFHLYLPADVYGTWRAVEGESEEDFSALMSHFRTPRDAAVFIMNQFNVVRERDEGAYARYRTKDRVLEIYDAMLEAQRTGQPYQTTLNPSPGTQS
jgi:hypothetical protein